MPMNQPLGRLVALQFRNIAAQPGAHPTVPILRVHLRVPDGSYHHHDLMNGDWLINNDALQFLALWGHKPSDIGGDSSPSSDEGSVSDSVPSPSREDSTMRDCLPDKTCVPIAPTGGGEWALAQTAMEGGQDALRNADWFNGDDSTKGGDDGGMGGGGSPDPGTGNRGGVENDEPEEETGVTAEMAPEESDQGITVNVE